MDDNHDDGNHLYNLACRCEELFDTPISGALKDQWSECQQRFAIWTSHLGVFARKSQSLDTRLRPVPDIQDLVARLLDILRRSLNQFVRSYSVPQQRLDLGTVTSLANIDSTLTRLSRLGVDIKQASRSRIDAKVNRFASVLDIRPFLTLSQVVVQALYPGAHESLKGHLSKTMIEIYTRIMYLRYRKDKLETRRPSKKSTPVSSLQTIGEDQETDVFAPQPEGAGDPLVVGTVTQCQPSASGKSMRSGPVSHSDLSTVDVKKIKLLLSPTPHESKFLNYRATSSIQIKQANYPQPSIPRNDNVFSCEWCADLFNKRETSESDWRRHVDKDLKPYKCISDRCPESHPCFTGFEEWLKHMHGHSQRWYQRAFPNPGWICAVCDHDEIYTSPQGLYSHLENSHPGQFSPSERQAISRQSVMERPRPRNECLLCCYTVEELEESDNGPANSATSKRHKEPLLEERNKMARMTLEMRNPDPHTAASESLDTSSDSDDESYRSRMKQSATAENSKMMARHIAAHLQVLMLLTIRLSSLSVDDVDSDDDEVNSYSVDINDSERSSESEMTDLISASAADTDVEMSDTHTLQLSDSDDEMAGADAPGADNSGSIPDAAVDLSDIPRPYDELDGENDPFLQKLVKSGAYQAHSKDPVPGASEPVIRIVSPPVEDKDADENIHKLEKSNGPYSYPDADVRIDNVILPKHMSRFKASSDGAVFKSRDPSCERERPLINLVLPSPPDSPLLSSSVPEINIVDADGHSIDIGSSPGTKELETSEVVGRDVPDSPATTVENRENLGRVVEISPTNAERSESGHSTAALAWGKLAAALAAGRLTSDVSTAEPEGESQPAPDEQIFSVTTTQYNDLTSSEFISASASQDADGMASASSIPTEKSSGIAPLVVGRSPGTGKSAVGNQDYAASSIEPPNPDHRHDELEEATTVPGPAAAFLGRRKRPRQFWYCSYCNEGPTSASNKLCQYCDRERTLDCRVVRE
ncbi:hypothetical protein QBC35DRAFT_409984 [Podospora australis]|uniref:Uncharacterized protein n=1 Tax=Podospora australis TaxID=1536484 RepID=A0AAN6WT54_9PEZI|nr:hypothetical protein QBC35DRAFT_409984 [Podospora australis]